MKCAQCRFYVGPPKQALAIMRGQEANQPGACHRNPPTVIPSMQVNALGHGVAGVATVWPAVVEDNWCGEYRVVAAVVAA